MDELWAQCTRVSLTGLTEKVWEDQVDLNITTNGDTLPLLAIIFSSKLCG